VGLLTHKFIYGIVLVEASINHKIDNQPTMKYCFTFFLFICFAAGYNAQNQVGNINANDAMVSLDNNPPAPAPMQAQNYNPPVQAQNPNSAINSFQGNQSQQQVYNNINLNDAALSNIAIQQQAIVLVNDNNNDNSTGNSFSGSGLEVPKLNLHVSAPSLSLHVHTHAHHHNNRAVHHLVKRMETRWLKMMDHRKKPKRFVALCWIP